MEVAFPLPTSKVACLFVCYNSAIWIPRALSSLRQGHLYFPYDTFLIDNASPDRIGGPVEADRSDLHAIQNACNLGFGGAANVGVRATESLQIVLINPDILVQPSAIEALISAMEADPAVAIASGKLLYPDGKTIQHAGGTITYPLALAEHFGYGEEDRGQHDVPREVDYVTGALFAVRRSAIERIGLFDEGFFPAYFEEADLCLRARQAGYKVLYVPTAVAIHQESVTTGKDTRPYYHFYHRNRIRFVLKHWSDDQLARDFFPAEVERMGGLGLEEVSALAEAYADNLDVLQGRASLFPNPAGVAPIATTPLRLRLVNVLAERALTRLDFESPSWKVDPPMSDPSSPDTAISRLESRARLTEPRFSSAAPLLGPALVRLRRAWNWMSTKWYVRPIVQQQNAFNAAVVDAVSDLHAQIAELEGKLETWEGTAVEVDRGVVGLTRDVALIESRLDRIEERLARIEAAIQSIAASSSAPPHATDR